jgi:hypothetical protein
MQCPYPVYPFLGYQTKVIQEPIAFPPQHQDQVTGLEYLTVPRPIFDYPGITGGDSGFGRAIAAAYAKEGADFVIVYLNEDIDAEETKKYVEQFGIHCLLLA